MVPLGFCGSILAHSLAILPWKCLSTTSQISSFSLSRGLSRIQPRTELRPADNTITIAI